jgi:hypothetical protein
MIKDIKDREPNEATIRVLEQWLQDAKDGRIRSIVALFGWDDDTWTHGWAMDRRNTRRRMLGEISMLQYDMLTNVSFEDGDSIISQAFEE